MVPYQPYSWSNWLIVPAVGQVLHIYDCSLVYYQSLLSNEAASPYTHISQPIHLLIWSYLVYGCHPEVPAGDVQVFLSYRAQNLIAIGPLVQKYKEEMIQSDKNANMMTGVSHGHNVGFSFVT